MASASLAANASATRRLDVEAVGRRARLAVVAHLGDHRPLDGGVEVGVGQHDEGRVAAELHRHVEHAIRRLLDELLAHLGAAGERQLPDARVLEHRRGDRAGAPTGHDVDDTWRHAGLGEDLGHRQRGERGERWPA